MPDAPIPASADGEGVFLVANSSSGQAVVRADPLPDIRRRLPAARIQQLGEDDSLDGAVAAAMAGAQPPRVLGILGGALALVGVAIVNLRR